MKSRVRGYTDLHYEHYTLRGIKICKRWLSSYENFLADMGECPDGLTLERKDNDGNYCKENCKWDTRRAQTINRRKTIFVTIDGEKLCLKDACDKIGVSYPTICSRIKCGMDPYVALQIPIQSKGGNTKVKSWPSAILIAQPHLPVSGRGVGLTR